MALRLAVDREPFHWVGVVPTDPNTHIYVHINRKACGLQVDKVLFYTGWDAQVVPAAITLRP
jgi:hypothetical protein